MKMCSLLSAALLLLFCQCGGNDSYILTETDCIPAFAGDSCLYIDRDDEPRFVGPYADASLFYDDLALVRHAADGKWGYIDDSGELVYPAVYTAATIFHENRAWVVRPDEAPCAIDTKGRLQLTLTQASKVMIFCEGMAAFAQKGKRGERWGFIDKSGKEVIKPLYRAVKPFAHGLAAVQDEKGRWGYVDPLGVETIPPHYEAAESFSAHRQAVVQVQEGVFRVIDLQGDSIWQTDCEELVSDGTLFRIKRAGQWGWCDAKGKEIIAPTFDDSRAFGQADLAPVKQQGKWGYIDRKGHWKIKRQFTDAQPFFDGLALVQAGTFYGFIDLDGHYRINPQYDRIAADYRQQALGTGSAFTTVSSDHARYK
ncbi:WG repeat-containing protein [Barnesiella viscericola]|uniref:WG repeat-containing protein n=1 Tax=Barnesiella viscericola TaxID=397865 RepID=UPI00235405C1|nr:WG repeat-containing protein [Barnesiella viscericola]